MLEASKILEFANHPNWVALSHIVFGMAFSLEQRRTAFKRAQGKCEDCGRSFKDGWLMNIHHQRPLHLGGKDTLDNAKCLCVECHGEFHRRLYEEVGKPQDYSAWKSLANGEKRTWKWIGKNR